MRPRRSNKQGSEFERSLFSSIALSPIATVVTNPHLPDNPIVYANQAFRDLTGYDDDELIGRNCRLLAGPGTDPNCRAALRDSIAQGRSTLTELVNYKKNGARFRNAVMIAPVLAPDRTIAYFIGSQMDVTGEPDPSLSLRTRQSSGLVMNLTPRQKQVLDWVIAGHRNKQIAALLGIGEKTVKMHRSAMLTRLSAASTADAIRIGLEARLLDAGVP